MPATNFFVSPLTGKTHDFVLVYGRVLCGAICDITETGGPEMTVWINDHIGCNEGELVEKAIVADGYWPLQVGDKICITKGLIDRNGHERQRIFMVEVYREGFVPPEPPKVDIGTGM